jgi:iron complex outermembrane receptor protein
LNIYGDEVAQTLPNIGRVSRTGYEEKDLATYGVYSLKLSGALHYRITDKLEAIYQGNYNQGTAQYTGSNRFVINDFKFVQHKLELKGSNFTCVPIPTTNTQPILTIPALWASRSTVPG